MKYSHFDDLSIEVTDHVARITWSRLPYNYFDETLLNQLAGLLELLDHDSDCRAIVISGAGNIFCAGANFGSDGMEPTETEFRRLYRQAVRLFKIKKPIIAAINGAAVGGGLGLALVADLRVSCPEAKFSANFARLGIHPGFGLTVTLPELIGKSRAALMFYSGKRYSGSEAADMGLVDVLTTKNNVLTAAIELGHEFALSSPRVVQDIRSTIRHGLAERVSIAMDKEAELQGKDVAHPDFSEGVQAMTERREPRFNPDF